MKCTVYDIGYLGNYKYVVTFAKYDGKWILCKHKDRDTWETSGGHIEKGETPIEAARRELYEETGSLEFDIEPVCDYWACDEPHECENPSWSNGAVFLADVYSLGDIPVSEMEKIRLFDRLPTALTYPDISTTIFPHVLKKSYRKSVNKNTDLKLSEIMEMQKQLQNKHEGKWTALTPGYGRSCLLWMVEELGEIVSVVKKRGESYIMEDPLTRDSFIEEFADVIMFMNDALICYGFNAEDLSNAILNKHNKNMYRDWNKEESTYILRK